MKRVALSILGGFVIPFVYIVISGPPSNYVEDERILWLLYVPIGWPKLLYFYFSTPFSRDSFAENETVFLLYILGCDVLLYTLLTYVALFVRSMLRRPQTDLGTPPPPHPN
ncbi:MAG TPA: hypothetical protein VF656_09750 [Pyrinomonadaceae bacterium]|jgi:hypothetical protein